MAGERPAILSGRPAIRDEHIAPLQQELDAKIAELDAELAKGGDGAQSNAVIDALRAASATSE